MTTMRYEIIINDDIRDGSPLFPQLRHTSSWYFSNRIAALKHLVTHTKRNELRLLHLISCVSDGTGSKEVMELYIYMRYSSDYPLKSRN